MSTAGETVEPVPFPQWKGKTPESGYQYGDEDGAPLFVVLRYPNKRFLQARLVDGEWIFNLNGVRRVLYHLDLLQAHLASNSREPVFICEGERDVEAVEAVGGVATCNPGGALKWTDEYAEMLQGARRGIVVADKDEPGRRHAARVVESLHRVGVAAEVVEAAEGKDAADHLAAGHGLEDFLPVETEPETETGNEQGSVPALRIVPLADFANTEEASAEPLAGTADETVMSADSDVIFYGDGGSSKTTTEVDALAHWAAGIPWLGIETPRRLRILLIENEGSRGKFREKVRRKIDTWTGPPFAENVHAFEEPWGGFSFAIEPYRQKIADHCISDETDVVAVGPLATLGAIGGGTPEEVNTFVSYLRDFRARVGRPIAIVIIHHENKGGDISGAWERVSDTLVHVRQDGKDRTLLWWRKVRWASELHGSRWVLRWITETAGFELVDSGKTTSAEREAALDQALEWIIEHVTANPGNARSKAETAYVEAHDGKGRNAARAAIDRELERLAEWTKNPTSCGEIQPQLATTTGEKTHGTYLIPFTDAFSPPATTPLWRDGEKGVEPLEPDASRHPPPAYKKGGGGGEMAEGVGDGPNWAEHERITADLQEETGDIAIPLADVIAMWREEQEDTDPGDPEVERLAELALEAQQADVPEIAEVDGDD